MAYPILSICTGYKDTVLHKCFESYCSDRLASVTLYAYMLANVTLREVTLATTYIYYELMFKNQFYCSIVNMCFAIIYSLRRDR